jgi:hypothetical protein
MTEKRQPLQQMLLGRLDIHMWKTGTRSLPPYTKLTQTGSKTFI